MTFGVAAATVSVTLEVASCGLASAAVDRTAAGDQAGMVLLDTAGGGLNQLIAAGSASRSSARRTSWAAPACSTACSP